MNRRLALVTVVVADYDEAIAWYTGRLGFRLIEDIDQGHKRWVVVGPPGARGARLLLARASDERQSAAIGGQAGGRVGFFLETDDFARDFAAFTERGVRFLDAPRHEPYGIVAVFEDLCGNKWDLIEAKRPAVG